MRILAISATLGLLWGSISAAHAQHVRSYSFHAYGWHYYGPVVPSAPYGPQHLHVGPRVYRESPAEAHERDCEHLARGGILLRTKPLVCRWR